MVSSLVSIVVPIYNTSHYLRECLDSILNQKYRDLEVILVDDGSTDDSSSICDEYAARESKVRVFHNANSGANASRKFGVEKAIGEYVFFVDADWLDSFFRYAVPDVDLVVQGHKLVRRDIECKQISEKDITIEAKTGCDILAQKISLAIPS